MNIQWLKRRNISILLQCPLWPEQKEIKRKERKNEAYPLSLQHKYSPQMLGEV